MEEPILTMRDISKSFVGVQALKGCSFNSAKEKCTLLWARMAPASRL